MEMVDGQATKADGLAKSGRVHEAMERAVPGGNRFDPRRHGLELGDVSSLDGVVAGRELETGRLRMLRSRAACLRTGSVFGRKVHAVARNEFTIAPFTSPQVPCRNCGETFAPVSTSRCGSCSCLNCFTIVAPAGVAVQSHSAWASEFLIRVSSAEKSVDVGAKIVVSTISKPYFFASFET